MSLQRFQRLLRIREIQENESAAGLATRLEDLRLAEQQRDRIQEYQRLYFDSLVPNDARMLKQMALMQSQLREALDQQELRVAAAEARMEQAREAWLERHRDTLSLEKLIERRRRTEDLHETRRQQREQDAWATQRAFRQIQEQG